VEDTIRFLVFIAFAGLLLLLRFDARRFGTAEYDDESAPGGWRVGVRRLTWYVLGIGLIYAVYRLHPLPISVLHLSLGEDRQEALQLGFIFGGVGTVVAFLFAWYRYRRLRLPAARHYPGGAINSIGTAVIDEALFRGIVMGVLLGYSWPPELAIAFQAILYGLATRLGAPGRSRAMLAISLGVGVVAGWLTLETGGIGAAILAHAVTRFAIFLSTGHAGQVRPLGDEPEEEASEGMPPDGWEVVGDAPQLPPPDVRRGRLRQVRPG
jgi:membrane protease YdiL (CAAX protease family)